MSYHQETINALTLLVELIRGDQAVEGRVRLQKLVYLLKAHGLSRLKGLKFSYHHYGPYSEQLAGALRGAVASKLIREDTEQFDDEWQKFSYSLVESHPDADFLKLTDDEVALVRSLKAATQQSHWRVLELAATTLFLERERGLPRLDAIERALGHKPACKPYRAQAEALLVLLADELGAEAGQRTYVGAL
jgi:uncharacterized protein